MVAAAVLYADRKSRGLAPYWPSALASLTGYTLTATPELAAAVSGAQRCVRACVRIHGWVGGCISHKLTATPWLVAAAHL